MGLTLSKNSATDLLICNIKDTIKDLIKNCELWTNDEICKNLEITFNNNLIKLNEPQLQEILISIGYKVDKHISKNKLCEIVINHFKKRIELLKLINREIDKCANMLTKAKKGPVCINVDKFVDDFFTCSTIPNALWIDQNNYKISIKNLKKQGRIDTFAKWLKDLDKNYYKSLRRILKIIDIIKKDIDRNISEYDFSILEKYTKKILCEMVTLCEIYYLLIINFR